MVLAGGAEENWVIDRPRAMLLKLDGKGRGWVLKEWTGRAKWVARAKGTWARAEGVRPQSQESHKGEEKVGRDRTGREG